MSGTKTYAIFYQGRPVLDKVIYVQIFVHANLAGDLDHKIPTSGYVSNLFGGAISWMSKRSVVVSLSTIEDE